MQEAIHQKAVCPEMIVMPDVALDPFYMVTTVL
jgi:hypothetical protein